MLLSSRENRGKSDKSIEFTALYSEARVSG
jgi:hypothetical protein